MDVREMRNEALGKRVVKALESRNMEAYYVKTKEEAVKPVYHEFLFYVVKISASAT